MQFARTRKLKLSAKLNRWLIKKITQKLCKIVSKVQELTISYYYTLVHKTIKYNFFVIKWEYLTVVINHIKIKIKFYAKIKYWKYLNMVQKKSNKIKMFKKLNTFRFLS